jgi:hypothetical protein
VAFDLVPWHHRALETRPSTIHGDGIFARATIPGNVPILRWGGRLVPESSVDEAGPPLRAVSVSEGVLLAVGANSERTLDDYLNHSCQPSVGMLDAVTLRTLRAVSAGAELTADYAFWTTDQDYALPGGCQCGLPRCRSRVTGRDWRRRDVQRHGLSAFSPLVQRLIAATDAEEADFARRPSATAARR